ncbi:Ca2+-binding RTX toxin-like protein [Pararhizobium capsulatum DSM 1112]|uniref:Ca2+-binding RTX toxin-like protein n=1 Tax=Pararhizobium capsulatum DSM 1112 TaxID=1121113 RepID=A0ABU0BTI1_9HYPH|nr:hypothetical protein [Pararhizobium capsulatum]MDQ0321558.1 Ca2+-binding RTX toxin-like protein [Pararhizobium capsulatum DSM 1112]
MGTSDTTITNDGYIFGGGPAAIYFNNSTDPTKVADVFNNGTIEGTEVGILRNSGSETIRVINTGTIKGGNFSFQQGTAATVAKDQITNNGKMIGAIDFGGGDDLYDGKLDTISGSIDGGAGADRLYSGAGNNTLLGGEGGDTLGGGGGADKLNGGAGTDTATYSYAKSAVTVSLTSPASNKGDAAGDTFVSIENIYGSVYNDALSGNSIANAISGSGGNDTIRGYGGNDTLTGGSGKDTFIFHTTLAPATNVDKITDFKAVDDTIQLENGIFTALTTLGTLSAAAFRANGTGLTGDSTDRIIYETDTGKIFYDRDGTGSSYDSVHFATLVTKPAITSADFIII